MNAKVGEIMLSERPESTLQDKIDMIKKLYYDYKLYLELKGELEANGFVVSDDAGKAR